MVSTRRCGGHSGGSSSVVKARGCRAGCGRFGSVIGAAADSGADSGVDDGFRVKNPSSNSICCGVKLASMVRTTGLSRASFVSC